MVKRLQGTDGIRREVMLSTDKSVAGLSPLSALLEYGVMTEKFMELYLYETTRLFIDKKLAKKGDRFAICYDPRDPKRDFIDHAINGISKGGLLPVDIGIMPTPALPLFVRNKNCVGGAVITASHNPASFNGIKIFTKSGLKFLPGDDEELSRRIFDNADENIDEKSMQYKPAEEHDRAVNLFETFSLDKKNSWIDDPDVLSKTTLILDTANGALSKVAKPIFKKAGFGEVILCNNSLDGSVNVLSGVADLEGRHRIERNELDSFFENYDAIQKLFEIGQQKRKAILEEGETVSLAVFDGDGDRFYRVDYDPENDCSHILTGDQSAVLQAIYIDKVISAKGSLFVNTVESDLAASTFAADLGFDKKLTAVGDKWILLTAIKSALQHSGDHNFFSRLSTITDSPLPSALAVEKLIQDEGVNFASINSAPFAVGAEESGHNITCGYSDNGIVFAGSGLKSGLNCYLATTKMYGAMPFEERQARIINPFESGYKKTLYAFYVEKEKFSKGSDAFSKLDNAIKVAIAEEFGKNSCVKIERPEDKDMLYYSIQSDEKQVGAIFIRNSGTEEKCGITLRSIHTLGEKLFCAGLKVFKVLLAEMKTGRGKYAQAELELLRAVEKSSLPEKPVGNLTRAEYERLLLESGHKQGFLVACGGKSKLSEIGRWYLEENENE